MLLKYFSILMLAIVAVEKISCEDVDPSIGDEIKSSYGESAPPDSVPLESSIAFEPELEAPESSILSEPESVPLDSPIVPESELVPSVSELDTVPQESVPDSVPLESSIASESVPADSPTASELDSVLPESEPDSVPQESSMASEPESVPLDSPIAPEPDSVLPESEPDSVPLGSSKASELETVPQESEADSVPVGPSIVSEPDSVLPESPISSEPDSVPTESEPDSVPRESSKASEPELVPLESELDLVPLEPFEISTTEFAPLGDLEESLIEIGPSSNIMDESCPSPCACLEEGNEYIVNCTGHQLTEFPSPLDPKTTELYLSDNKLPEIPAIIKSLTKLKILDADNNLIMEIAQGSLSQLSELQVLKLNNNNILEYPNELKNSPLTQLLELDLGGNDIQPEIKSEELSNLIALRELTIPTSNEKQILSLCTSLKNTLKTVCTESCLSQSFECVGAPEYTEEELRSAVNPGTIAFDNAMPDDDLINKSDAQITTTSPATNDASNNIISPIAAIASRSGMVNTEPKKMDTIVEAPANDQRKSDVNIGATTTGPNKGGVDKSVIGFIVAGMVVVVAGITIQKNWSSIRKRFSSSSRTPNGRVGANANGNAPPEEVPLQEKSPV